MKKSILQIAFLFFFTLTTFSLYATPTMVGITTEAIPVNPQTGSYNYFGVKVTIDQTYDQNITISGYIYDEGSFNTLTPFSLTVYAGYTTAETSTTFYQTAPATTAVTYHSSSMPLYVTKNNVTYTTEDAIGNIFGTLNPTTLQTTDETTARNYSIQLGSQFQSFLSSTYPNKSLSGVDFDDTCIVFMALVHAMGERLGFQDLDLPSSGNIAFKRNNFFDHYSLEQNGYVNYALYGIGETPGEFNQGHYPIGIFKNPYSLNNDPFLVSGYLYGVWDGVPLWARCTAEAIGGLFTIGDLYNSYAQLFRGGASFSTIFGVVKQFARRYAGWFAAINLVYDVGECAGWW